MPATDRLLALALEIHEGRIDPSHGQRRDLAMDPDLAEEWTGLDPLRDHAATAMARLADEHKDADHPETLRYVLGLREGWEERREARRQARLSETN